MGAPEPFPTDWTRCLVMVAHPDDPEYGISPAVARWVSEGRHVSYVLATSGEAGIEGMDAATCGPLREEEQRRSSAAVGVTELEFLGFPDGRLADTPELRDALADAIRRHRPDVVVSLFSGPEFAPGRPNQSDHMEFGAAVGHVVDDLAAADGVDSAAADGIRPRMWFESAPGGDVVVDVAGFVDDAVAALAEHREYLAVLDPSTPVAEQARAQVEMICAPEPGVAEGHPIARFRRLRP